MGFTLDNTPALGPIEEKFLDLPAACNADWLQDEQHNNDEAIADLVEHLALPAYASVSTMDAATHCAVRN